MTDTHHHKRPIVTSNDRKSLFLELAGHKDGTSVLEVHKQAAEHGDSVTEEAYYNLARRLVHRGLLVQVEVENETRYKVGAYTESQWLEEEELCTMVDPEYPLPALTIWKEAQRQISDIPEDVWVELRERLRNESARDLFRRAIESYCTDFYAQIGLLVEHGKNPTPEISKLRQEAENSLLLLQRLTKYGLGLSREAVHLPVNIDVAIKAHTVRQATPYLDQQILTQELARRIDDEQFIVDVHAHSPERTLVVGAVDGSTRGGVLSFLGESGDFSLGNAPMVAINTSVGQVNASQKVGGRMTPLFIRLPEKPEDMQRQDNRYTIMAKLFYPDLSESEYMHSLWNAMDLIETKAALRLLGRWYAPKTGIEVPPCDVVLRDGAVAPQARDFHHYSWQTSYGRIVRDMIATNWDIAKKCLDDGQTLGGVVKMAQLSVFAPVINWFACQIAGVKSVTLHAWPLPAMNLMPDQLLLTRILTAGRKKNEPWVRTCVVLRPFHSTTNFAKNYSRAKTPSQIILEDSRTPRETEPDKMRFWETFRAENDPYLKMLDNVHYASFFLGAVPRLDIEKNLPRFEFLVMADTREDSGDPCPMVPPHRNRLISAIESVGFNVSAEHSMFSSEAKLDVLPTLVIRVHDTVKLWATEFLSRVQEYIGSLMARYVKGKRLHGMKVRPFTRQELEVLYAQLKSERDQLAGDSDKMLEQ